MAIAIRLLDRSRRGGSVRAGQSGGSELPVARQGRDRTGSACDLTPVVPEDDPRCPVNSSGGLEDDLPGARSTIDAHHEPFPALVHVRGQQEHLHVLRDGERLAQRRSLSRREDDVGIREEERLGHVADVRAVDREEVVRAVIEPAKNRWNPIGRIARKSNEPSGRRISRIESKVPVAPAAIQRRMYSTSPTVSGPPPSGMSWPYCIAWWSGSQWSSCSRRLESGRLGITRCSPPARAVACAGRTPTSARRAPRRARTSDPSVRQATRNTTGRSASEQRDAPTASPSPRSTHRAPPAPRRPTP